MLWNAAFLGPGLARGFPSRASKTNLQHTFGSWRKEVILIYFILMSHRHDHPYPAPAS